MHQVPYCGFICRAYRQLYDSFVYRICWYCTLVSCAGHSGIHTLGTPCGRHRLCLGLCILDKMPWLYVENVLSTTKPLGLEGMLGPCRTKFYFPHQASRYRLWKMTHLSNSVKRTTILFSRLKKINYSQSPHDI